MKASLWFIDFYSLIIPSLIHPSIHPIYIALHILVAESVKLEDIILTSKEHIFRGFKEVN